MSSLVRLRGPAARALALAVAAWTAYTLFTAEFLRVVNAVPDHPVARGPIYFRWGLQGLVWLLLTGPIFEVSRRWPFRRGGLLRAVVVHFAAAVGAQVVLGGADRWAAYALFHVTDRPLFYLLSTFRLNLLVYAVVVAAEHAYRHALESRDQAVETAFLRTRLVEAQLEALRSQLQPHFLFNALHDISELIYQDRDRAERSLARVGDLLRASLETTGRQEVTLREELEVLEAYLDVQRMRFGDALSVMVLAPAETLDILVPTLLVQPLVENAIKHGTRPGGEARVEVTASLDGPSLQVQVSDRGPGMPQGAPADGTGLRVTRARLQGLYGAAQSLSAEDAPGGGARITVRIPARAQEPGA